MRKYFVDRGIGFPRLADFDQAATDLYNQGKLVVNEMGHSSATGSWRVNNDQLCKVLPGVLDACYEVWGAGDRIELHYGDAPPLEAFLRPATAK